MHAPYRRGAQLVLLQRQVLATLPLIVSRPGALQTVALGLQAARRAAHASASDDGPIPGPPHTLARKARVIAKTECFADWLYCVATSAAPCSPLIRQPIDSGTESTCSRTTPAIVQSRPTDWYECCRATVAGAAEGRGESG
jgi:hypothetical protein